MLLLFISGALQFKTRSLLRRKDISKLSEQEIILLAKSDNAYFGSLYDTYFECIFRFVFKRTGGKEDLAGDLTQQTFLKAMANISKYEDRGFPFSSWLYRIAQNEVSMFFRSSKINQTVELEERLVFNLIEECQFDNVMSLEEQENLMLILNEMNEEHLELIELRFFQEMSFKDIAVIYGITEANAKMRVYRILEKLNKTWNSKK